MGACSYNTSKGALLDIIASIDKGKVGSLLAIVVTCNLVIKDNLSRGALRRHLCCAVGLIGLAVPRPLIDPVAFVCAYQGTGGSRPCSCSEVALVVPRPAADVTIGGRNLKESTDLAILISELQQLQNIQPRLHPAHRPNRHRLAAGQGRITFFEDFERN